MGLHRIVSLAGVTAATLATTAAFNTAWAGPRVGDSLGQASTVSSTVQAKVISATPIVGQVTVPRKTCFDELRQEPPRSSGAGALLGAIAGGAVGNAVGKGAGNALATGLGIFGGAILGDHIQNDGRQGSTRTVRRCEQQATVENRVVAYSVVYEYAGQRYTTQTNKEPGRTIPVQMTLAPVQEDEVYQGPRNTAWDDDEEWDEDEEGGVTPAYEPPPPPRHRHHRSWY